MTPTRGRLRLARWCAFVATCLGLAVAGHAAGGADLPAPAGVAALLPLIGLAGLWFTGRERGVGSLFASLGLTQLALHALFHLAHHAAPALPAAAPAAGPGGHAAHGAAAGHLAGHLAGHAAAGPPALVDLLPSGPMLFAHLGATLLAALLLGWGERSLWAAARRLLLTIPRLEAVFVAPRALPTATSARSLHGIAVAALAPVRGPPRGPLPA